MGIEDRLRDALLGGSPEAPPGEELFERVLLGVRRRQRRTRLAFAAGAFAVAVFVGTLVWAMIARTPNTGPVHPPPTNRGIAPAAIPFRPLPPVAIADAAPSPCGAEDLRLSADGWDGLVGGTMVGWVRALNRSTEPCRIRSGVHLFSVLDASGRALSTKIINSRDAERRRVVLAGHGTAIASVFWSQWCKPSPGKLTFDLSIPGLVARTHVPVDGEAEAPCSGSPEDGPPTFWMHAWDAKGYLAPSPLARLGIRIEAPASATEGAVLRYAVVLTNHSHAALRITACPNFRQTLFDPGQVGQRYQLNCAALGGRIAQGGSARFAMRLRVPNDFLDPLSTRLGHDVERWEARLDWGLIVQGTGPTASTRILVRAV
jgi:Protein of unknown function (DUF4232)